MQTIIDIQFSITRKGRVKKTNEKIRSHPDIGCCGIDCVLCPRFFTDGVSRCPGCGGEGFSAKHPSCSFITCCVKKRGHEICAECGNFPCKKYEAETGEHDSFVTHRKVFANQNLISEIGMYEFLVRQKERKDFLKTALEIYDDGKSKSFFCLAAALLSASGLKTALERAKAGENLRDVLSECAQKEQVELKLRK